MNLTSTEDKARRGTVLYDGRDGILQTPNYSGQPTSCQVLPLRSKEGDQKT